MSSIFTVHGSNATVKWQDEPVTRGTWTILSTCIITLFLFSERLAWIAGALLAPEYLILTAWSQRQMAKNNHSEVEKTLKIKKTVTAIMGGIAIDQLESDPLIPNSKRSTLTPNGVSFLLKHEPQLLPDIPAEEVKDKSKGSSFIKFAACLQATWFCLSCLVRIVQKIPISMLELNTFAHALCTVIVYILWWRKPLDIELPLAIQDERIQRLLAYMWMSSKPSCIPKPKSSSNSKTVVGRDPEFEAITLSKRSATEVATDHRDLSATQTACDSIGRDALEMTKPIAVTVTTAEELPGTGFRAKAGSTRWKEHHEYSSGDEHHSINHSWDILLPAVFKLTPTDVRRWQLAREAMDKYNLTKPDKNLDLVTIRTIPELSNFNSDYSSSITWASLGFSLVAAAYGGLHGLAWDAHFPTPRERKLWRISALIIASPAGVLLLFLLFCHTMVLAKTAVRFFHSKLPSKDSEPQSTEKTQSKSSAAVREEPRSQSDSTPTDKITTPVFEKIERVIECLANVILGTAIMFLYFPARMYLVYESLRTVFLLPPEAYEATGWTQYLPHIT